MFNQSSCLYRFKSYHFSEIPFLEKLKQQLKTIYEDTEIEKGQQSTKITNVDASKAFIQSVKEKYRRNSNCSAPWIDTLLWDHILSVDTKDIPRSITTGSVEFTRSTKVFKSKSTISKGFANEVKQSDSQCIERYISKSRRLSSIQIRSFGLAGIIASRQLKIISNNGLKNVRSARSSVISTSKSTNSGWPFFKKKSDDFCIKDSVKWLKEFLLKPNYYTLFKNSIFENPTSLFHRVQASMKDDNSASGKIRQVWCVPQRIISLEHYFFSEILSNVCLHNKSKTSSVYTSGLTNLEISMKVVSRLRNKLRQDAQKSLYSLDYSKYDQTIPNFAIDLFFSIIKDTLELSPLEDKAYETLRCYTRNTPLCNNGSLFIKEKGIMSGTYITNLFDTWFNLTLWILSKNVSRNYRYSVKLDFDTIDFINYVITDSLIISDDYRDDIGLCGDDVIVYTDYGEISIHNRLCLSLGMSVTVGGTYFNTEEPIFFLGRYWDEDSRPFQTDCYMIAHICFRTKFYSKLSVDFDISEDLSVNRILSICLPLYNGYEFIMKYFKDWKPMSDFLNSNRDFTLLKEWPNDNGYIRMNRSDAFKWYKY